LTIKIDQLRTNDEVTPRVGAALDELRRDTTEVTDDVHRLSHRLHSSTLDYLGLVPALQKLVSEFSERHNISIAFAHASVPASLPSEIALCLFRVAEESLTNIAKHSKADAAKVHVTGAPDGIHLSVEDAGVGFDTAGNMSRPGLGLVSMQERLRAVHGTIQVNSAPSGGTKIDAWVPPTVMKIDRQEPVH
jgi:signal transduction histidine kinase